MAVQDGGLHKRGPASSPAEYYTVTFEILLNVTLFTFKHILKKSLFAL